MAPLKAERFFNTIATITTIVLALLLLSSLLVIYIPPTYLGFYVYSGFIFPLFWFLNLITLIFWFLRWRMRFLIPLIAITLVLPQWHQTFESGIHIAPTKEKKSISFSVLSYNVRTFDIFDWSNTVGNTKKIFEFIKQQDADVLCIQEFFANNDNGTYGINTINNHFAKYPYRHICYDGNDRDKGFGIATYSKYPIVKREFLRFNFTSNSSMYTDIVIKGETIRVFNNHLESIRLTKEHINLLDSLNYQTETSAKKGLKQINQKMKAAFAIRTNQADKLATLISQSPYPTLVCGDFNDTPISYVYHTMKGDLSDPFVTNGSGFGGTYHGLFVPFRIDFLFYSHAINCYTYKKIKVPYSDHYPIYGQFFIN